MMLLHASLSVALIVIPSQNNGIRVRKLHSNQLYRRNRFRVTAKIRHFDSSERGKQLTLRPNQPHDDVLGVQAQTFAEKQSIKQNFFFAQCNQ